MHTLKGAFRAEFHPVALEIITREIEKIEWLISSCTTQHAVLDGEDDIYQAQYTEEKFRKAMICVSCPRREGTLLQLLGFFKNETMHFVYSIKNIPISVYIIYLTIVWA